MNKAIIAVVVVVILIGGYAFMNSGSGVTPEPTTSTTAPAAETAAATITYENNAWNPAAVTVKAGEAVRIINKHRGNIRAVSNPHPFHTSQPDFDSDTLAPGEEYTYTTKAGTKKIEYHNHFNPGALGEIIVQ